MRYNSFCPKTEWLKEVCDLEQTYTEFDVFILAIHFVFMSIITTVQILDAVGRRKLSFFSEKK
jgi:hypothetical protein